MRDPDGGARAARTMQGRVEVRVLDLASLQSIRAFAAGWDAPIDLLINNAGVSVPDLQRTEDGFEMQSGTNHLGPFALTNLLLSQVTGRVVSLSSQAERFANLVFIAELQRRLTAAGSPVIAAAAHPVTSPPT